MPDLAQYAGSNIKLSLAQLIADIRIVENFVGFFVDRRWPDTGVVVDFADQAVVRLAGIFCFETPDFIQALLGVLFRLRAHNSKLTLCRYLTRSGRIS